MSNGTQPAIQLDKVNKWFGQLHVLRDVSLEVATGEKVVVANYDAYNEVVAYYRGVENIPATMKFGFTGSTGGSTNYHELQAMRVMSLEDAPGFEPVAPEGSTWSMVVAGALLVGVSKRRRKRTAA